MRMQTNDVDARLHVINCYDVFMTNTCFIYYLHFYICIIKRGERCVRLVPKKKKRRVCTVSYAIAYSSSFLAHCLFLRFFSCNLINSSNFLHTLHARWKPVQGKYHEGNEHQFSFTDFHTRVDTLITICSVPYKLRKM